MFIICPWNFLQSIHLYHPNSFPVSLVDILRLFERLLKEGFFDFSSNQFTDQLASQYTIWQSVQKVDLIYRPPIYRAPSHPQIQAPSVNKCQIYPNLLFPRYTAHFSLSQNAR